MDENELKALQTTIAGAIQQGIREGMAATVKAQSDAKSGKTTNSFGGGSGGFVKKERCPLRLKGFVYLSRTNTH